MSSEICIYRYLEEQSIDQKQTVRDSTWFTLRFYLLLP